MRKFDKKFPFPAPSGPYKVEVASGDWKPFKAARLQISMNNPKHAGEKFFAQAEWAAARFDKVQLIVSDTLHRYNIMGSHSVDDKTAHDLALQIGNDWISDNATAIALLPNHEITRWDDWLTHQNFVTAHGQVLDCYAKDSTFAAEVERTVSNFMLRKADMPIEKRETQIRLSRAYLLEELAAFALMQDSAPMIDVRPGSPLKPVLDLLKSGAIAGAPAGCEKLNSVVIDFTKNKAFHDKKIQD
jgi:tRNA-dependent cyclodipeptide synthase